jgi:hypothetical protein
MAEREHRARNEPLRHPSANRDERPPGSMYSWKAPSHATADVDCWMCPLASNHASKSLCGIEVGAGPQAPRRVVR